MSQHLASHGPDQRPRLNVLPVRAGKLRPLAWNCSCGLCTPSMMLRPQVGGLRVSRRRPDLILVSVQDVHGHTRSRGRGGSRAQLGEDAGDAHQASEAVSSARIRWNSAHPTPAPSKFMSGMKRRTKNDVTWFVP